METIVSIFSTIFLLCTGVFCPCKTSITCRPIFCLYFCIYVNRSQIIINSKSQLSNDIKRDTWTPSATKCKSNNWELVSRGVPHVW